MTWKKQTIEQRLDELERRELTEETMDEIARLTEMRCKMHFSEEKLNEQMQNGMQSLKKNLRCQSRRQRRLRCAKRVTVFLCCCCMIFGTARLSAMRSKCFSLLFSAIQMTTGGAWISLQNEDSMEKEFSAVEMADPFGIRALCAEHGFAPMVPQDLPKGIQLKSTKVMDSTHYAVVQFFFVDDLGRELSMEFSFHAQCELQDHLGVATDEYTFHCETVSGKEIYIAEELDGEYKAAFMHQNIQYAVGSKNFNYAELFRILESIC